MSSLTGKAAIAGIGQTEFSKESGRSELQLACEAVKAAIDDAGLRPSDVDGMVTFTVDANDEIEIARNVGIGDLTFFTPGAPRRRGRGGHGGAGRDGRGDGHGQRRGVLPRVQRTLRVPVRRRDGAADRRDSAVHGELRAVRLDDACGVGGTARPALHVDLRRHQRGLRPDLRRRPRTRGAQSRRVVLRTADHHRGPPELAVDHRAGAAPARLLPGERRRRRDRHHQRRARAGSSPAPRGDHRRGAGCGRRRRDDDELLPRRHHRPAGDGRGRRKALARFGTQTRRHPDRVPLRPLHPVRLRPTRRARLLRPRRGQGLRDDRDGSRSAGNCRSTPTAACSARHTSTA